MKRIIQGTVLCMAIIISHSSSGQISGNQAYRDRYRPQGTDGSPVAVMVRDSLMFVTANILYNANADSFILTLAVNEEAKTVKEANTAINARISSFRKGLSSLAIPPRNIYVDFITQTKIYDFSGQGLEAVQYLKGFEIKKNIIIGMNASADIDRLLELAAEHGIYDVVKVDYLNQDVSRIYAEMMMVATQVVNRKKELYLKISPVRLMPVPRISSEVFHAVHPGSQYQQYMAYESSDITTTYNAELVRRVARKDKTFYYNRIEQSGFDQVINNNSPVVGIQYVLRLVMEFRLQH